MPHSGYAVEVGDGKGIRFAKRKEATEGRLSRSFTSLRRYIFSRFEHAGGDLVLPIPDGTVVWDGDEVVADLVGAGSRAVLAEGGRGGRGNALLASSRNRAPRVAEPGEPVEERTEVLSLWEHFASAGAWNKTHETGYFLQQTRFLLLGERGDDLNARRTPSRSRNGRACCRCLR